MFILKDGGTLVAMKPEAFKLERDFQDLLSQHSELLAGELIDPSRPRRWALVKAEMAVPAEMDGSGVWSLDHLFLDQDGILTLVEVKRQSDTRLRREVIAQMLDYAAHGAAYWTVDVIRAAFEETCKSPASDELQAKLGINDPDSYWQAVKTNLEARKLRLLFVADEIPKELRLIVEFLNNQMESVDVLALELRQFAGEGNLKTLVPTLYGQTEESQAKKGQSPGVVWTEDRFFGELGSKENAKTVEVAKKIYEWMKKYKEHPVFGRGKTTGSITIYVPNGASKLYPLSIWSSGTGTINFRDCMKPPFDNATLREEWRQKLNAVGGIDISPDQLEKQPTIYLKELSEKDRLEKFLGVLDWFVAQVKAAPATGAMT